ncbi:MAG TPA: OsmC family protein [Steroidobacteraceae bacterium]|nr:OsmC family protein [Steroidobacteraceae bacterium]HRX90454.1 OsmC family protein [Steroidobacteraceae bacterium]
MKEGVRYPDYVGVSDVTTQSYEHMRLEAFFDGQPSIMFDEPEGFDIGDPPDLRGRSRGWTPVHAQLAALAGCTSITIAVVARDQQLKYSQLSTKIRSLIDIRGFFFDLHLQPKYQQVNFDLTLRTKASTPKIKELARETHRRCPQLGVFRLAKIPLLVTWYRAGSKRPLFEERFGLRAGRTPEERLIQQAKPAKKRKG